jgi:hypothetical protein
LFVVQLCFAVLSFAQSMAVPWLGFFWELPVVDDTKRQHDLKLWLTDREWLDLTKAAAHEDRKVGEMGQVIIRKFMYGNMGPCAPEVHGANSAQEGQGE